MDALNESGAVPHGLQIIDIEPVNAIGSSEPARVVRAIIEQRALHGAKP